MLKILQFIDRLNTGGAERVFVDLCNMLSGRFEITVLLLSDDGELVNQLKEDIKVVVVPRSNKWSLGAARKIACIIEQQDIVHVHMRYNLVYLQYIDLFIKKRVPKVFHDHYGLIDSDRSVGWALRASLKKVVYIGVSETLTDWAKANVKLKPKNVFTINNIVLPHTSGFISENPNRLNNRVVSVANFRQQKNIEFLIDLFSKLHSDSKLELQLDIIGIIAEKKYYFAMKEKINSMGLQDSINIITNCSNPSDHFFQYKYAIHTAKSESGPLVVLEYLRAGLPYFMFKTGSYCDSLEKEFPDFYLDSDEIESWIDKIDKIDLLYGEGVQKTMLSRFETEYSVNKYIEKIERVYKCIGV